MAERKRPAFTYTVKRDSLKWGCAPLLLIAALSLLDELSAAQHSIETVSGPDIDRASRALETASERILALAGRIETEL